MKRSVSELKEFKNGFSCLKMKINFGMSNMPWVELEARWKCCFWALLLAEVSLTLLSGLAASLGKVHKSVAPFFGVDHK